MGIELQPYQFTVVLVNEDGGILGDETRGLPGMEPEAVVRTLAAAAQDILPGRGRQGADDASGPCREGRASRRRGFRRPR